MNNPTRCTWCISLLKNAKQFSSSHYYKINDEMYIDVQDLEVSKKITSINEHMEKAYELYHQLLNEE